MNLEDHPKSRLEVEVNVLLGQTRSTCDRNVFLAVFGTGHLNRF